MGSLGLQILFTNNRSIDHCYDITSPNLDTGWIISLFVTTETSKINTRVEIYIQNWCRIHYRNVFACCLHLIHYPLQRKFMWMVGIEYVLCIKLTAYTISSLECPYMYNIIPTTLMYLNYSYNEFLSSSFTKGLASWGVHFILEVPLSNP